MQVKYIVEDDMLAKRNIVIENEDMPCGETRFRVKWQDFSGVNITVAGDKPEWQNAHYHEYSKELYLVQKGKILMAIETLEGNVEYKVLKAGETIILEPFTNHNVYMCADTMTYVIKFGDTKEKDWNLAERLDEISKKCNVEEHI